MIYKAVFVVVLAAGVLSEPTLKARCHGDEPDKAIFADYLACANRTFDIEVVGNEIQNAKTFEDYKGLFTKYCPKFPQLKLCVRDLFIEVGTCQGLTYRDVITDVFNGGDDIINFVCENNGERFATFIVDGAFKCLERKNNGINECLAAMQNAIAPAELDDLPLEEQCRLLGDLRSCAVRAQESCPTRAAVDMIESLYPYVTKALKCKN